LDNGSDKLLVIRLAKIKGGKFTRVKKSSPNGDGGTAVTEKENHEGLFEAFSKMGESFYSMEGAKKAAAWYIETSEKLAHQALDMQSKATKWAKETPLAPLFEAQCNMARKFVERSMTAARNLWQIPQE
jgi:hypothetical protein